MRTDYLTNSPDFPLSCKDYSVDGEGLPVTGSIRAAGTLNVTSKSASRAESSVSICTPGSTLICFPPRCVAHPPKTIAPVANKAKGTVVFLLNFISHPS